MLPIYLPQFFAAMVLGLVFSDYFSGRADGERIERSSTRFKLGDYRLNFHNWMWSSILLGLCLYFHITDPITTGLIIGSILQGLSYKDRFVIFYKAEDFEKIYSKFYT